MGISIRAYWTGTCPNTNRDVYVNVTTLPGDFLVAFGQVGDNSANWTTYQYDTLGTPVNFNKETEYSRGVTQEVCMFYLDPGATVGSKQCHFYYGNGAYQTITVMALTGVRPSGSRLSAAQGGHYYTHLSEDWVWSMSTLPSGIIIAGQGAGISGSWTDYSTNLFTTYLDDNPNTNNYRNIKYKVVTGTTESNNHLCHPTSNFEHSGAAIALAAGGAGNQIIMLWLKRYQNLLRDLKLGLLPASELRRRYGTLRTECQI